VSIIPRHISDVGDVVQLFNPVIRGGLFGTAVTVRVSVKSLNVIVSARAKGEKQVNTITNKEI
jgi:hypothetical protein